MRKMNRTWHRAVSTAAVAFAASVFLTACGKEAPAPAEAPPVRVAVAAVEAGPLLVTYRVSATMEAWEKADVSAEVPGVVRTMGVEEGDFVRAGALLARLDAAVLSSNVAEVAARMADAEIAAADARTNLERVETLRREGAASQSELDNARTRLQRAEEGIAALRGTRSAASAQLAKTTLLAPIAGLVTQRNIEPGEMASPGRVLFRVENLSALKAVMRIPAQEMRGMEIGDQVIVSTAEGDSLTGKIIFISRAADPTTRTVKVEARFDNPASRVRSGIFGEALIVRTEIPRTVRIPKTALARQDGDEGVVYVVEGGVARKREVRLGESSESFFQVLAGLREGERIVPADHTALADGVKVAPAERTEPTGPQSTPSETSVGAAGER